MNSSIVNFSLKKEIFFVTIGSLIGAFTMHLPRIFLDLVGDSSYIVTLLVSAQVVNSTNPIVGFLLHLFVATVIGVTTGILLYKLIKFNLSKIATGLIYGIIAGIVVFIVFAIPVSQLLLGPNLAEILSEINPEMSYTQALEEVENSFVTQMLNSLLMHIIWGLTLGIVTSLFTRKIGANYLCRKCNIEFSKLQTWNHHYKHVHENPTPFMKKILIIGGGYAGVGVLNKIQKQFQDDVNVSISIISENNFFLHTPMLPELSTGTIEPRHIATPIRNFCKRARFYQGKVFHIDLENQRVSIKVEDKETKLEYDYLVIAAGTKTGFFGNENLKKYSLTIKSLHDASIIRNRIIAQLELADQQESSKQSEFLSFVVVGGGFSGVETAGEINEFIRESAEKYYRNIESDSIQVNLIAARDHILPEIGNLGKYAAESLEKAGVKIIYHTKVIDANSSQIVLSDNHSLNYSILIWAGGNEAQDFVQSLNVEHDRSGRLMVDKYLRLTKYPNVFALGDCAHILDSANNPYPPTAQHAIREAQTASNNLISSVNGTDNFKIFEYSSKGSMAKIGKRDGVAKMLGMNLTGFTAWFVWKQYYLSTLPVMEKRIRVGLDWFVDLFFTRDITKLN